MTVSSFTFQNAVGKVAQLHYEAKNLGSPRGLVVVIVDRGAATNETMETATTLSGLLAGTPNEVTNTNYARHNITSGGAGQLLLPAIAYDTGTSKMPGDLPDQTYSLVPSGDAWTDAIVCYAPDTAGADSTFIPLTCNRNQAVPDGGNITVSIANYWTGARP